MPAPVGRPRNEEARKAVLIATRNLVVAHGSENVTMVQIADAAGVVRPTVYRWWPTKEAVIADAVLSEALPLHPIFAEASGDLGKDLEAWVRRSIARIEEPESAALYRALLAASMLDESARRRMDESFAVPLRAAIHSVFAAAGRPGEAEVAADILIGAMLNVLVAPDSGARGRLRDVASAMARGADV